MSRSINPISLFKTGTETFPTSTRFDRFDESADGYSSTGCSSALPASASPADLSIHAAKKICQRRFRETGKFLAGLERRVTANYKHPGWPD